MPATLSGYLNMLNDPFLLSLVTNCLSDVEVEQPDANINSCGERNIPRSHRSLSWRTPSFKSFAYGSTLVASDDKSSRPDWSAGSWRQYLRLGSSVTNSGPCLELSNAHLPTLVSEEQRVHETAEGRQIQLLGAAATGNEAVVKLLLAHPDIDVNSKDQDGETPLWRAAAEGREAMVRLLLAQPDIDNNYGLTPLHWTAAEGREAMVRLLLAQPDIDVNSKDNHGRTPLSSVVRAGHKAVAELLLARSDIDVNLKDNHRLTPLQWGVAVREEVVVKLLLAHPNIDVNLNQGAVEKAIQDRFAHFCPTYLA
ncbi:hypothetical protein W97_07600 [Coniosporium apollinis CBS 100218]|uniref:Uncharacterized protein n=1 Tax=Coniosporium apollinis (strain CBS 100218) TaxID=1168221 RepID=R7Z2E5_CONA1|nr:uncharacterized protein W97_07600 [Coniosporium apollinis CBS 100218]EON68342.1 hypothetical protein W97_07600 [Coniosporium apollinis CBS 100218]